MSDPSLLITRPTSHDPDLAPPDRHLHYVLAPCPNTDVGPSGAQWRDLGPRYRDSLVAELERRGLDGFADSVEEELLVTPLDWAAQGHAAGSPFSVSHTFAQTGPFRPRNVMRGLENVVLAGCGTTPGVGVPTVLISGKLAAARVTGGTPVVRRGGSRPPLRGARAVAPIPEGTHDPS
ncbi:phytoene desaturase, partial [Streptomyces flaveolus]